MQQPAPGRDLVAAPPPDADPGPAAAEAFERTARVVLGAAGLALAAVRELLERADPARSVGPDVATALRTRIRPVVSVALQPLVAHGPLAAASRHLDLRQWSDRARAEQRRNEELAAAFLRAALAAMVAAVLEQVDVDAVIARADLDRIVERLDLDAIVLRLDVDAVVRRVDLADVTERVMEEVDIGQVVRESSSTMASETIDALRMQGMQADQVLSRIVDRFLRRRGQRDTGPGLAAASAGEVGS